MIRTEKLLLFTIVVLLLQIPFKVLSQSFYKESAMNEKHRSARNNILDEQFVYAIDKYSELLKKEDNSTVRAEYAYALALSKCYDGSIMNLDKILISGKADKTTLFYIAQVLKLMEYYELADVFWTADISNPPSWLWTSDKYKSLADKYKFMAAINIDDLGATLQRVNFLVAQKQYIQSVVLYQELVETYPNEYLPYIGFSTLWESIGYKELAIDYLQTGIDVMGDKKSEYDSESVYEKHLAKLKNDNTKKDKVFAYANLKDLGNKAQTQTTIEDEEGFKRKFLYFGLTYIHNATSINARYGFYNNGKKKIFLIKTSFSIDFGYSKTENIKIFAGNISYNFHIDNFVCGLSVASQINDGNFDGGFGFYDGFSVPSQDKRSSFDFRVGIYYYMIKAKSLNYNFSVGFTRYF